MNKDTLSYYSLRFLMAPFSIMPYRLIHLIGKVLGKMAYYLLKKSRKATLSNIALANTLPLSKKEMIKVAKESFENLIINLLEYSKFSKDRRLDKVLLCENPEVYTPFSSKGLGMIFFCGHLANWETLFLYGSAKLKATAIGKPIYNRRIYDWITSIREKFGGKMLDPHNAMKEGVRALKEGSFLGIVGDQGMPGSGYHYPFFGRRAWSSMAPALLAYRTNCPIMVATTKREKGKYLIHLSDPIFPDRTKRAKEDVPRMMDQTLKVFEESIRKNPGQWLWQHNRWKQQLPGSVYKKYRHDSILIILPEEKQLFDQVYLHLKTLKKIYPDNFFFLLVPTSYQTLSQIPAEETTYYKRDKELYRDDFRYKLVFNFTNNKKVSKHYNKKCAQVVLSKMDIENQALRNGCMDHHFSHQLIYALCRPKSIDSMKGELDNA